MSLRRWRPRKRAKMEALRKSKGLLVRRLRARLRVTQMMCMSRVCPGLLMDGRPWWSQMEGYSVRVPDAWEVGSQSSFLELVEPSGWSLSIRRHPSRVSLLRLAESRLGDLQETSTDSADISMDMEPIRAGESMRLVRLGDDDYPNWIEYIVVRAPLGAEGLSYSLAFIRGDSDAPLADAIVQEIVRAFTLLRHGRTSEGRGVPPGQLHPSRVSSCMLVVSRKK